MNAAMNMGTIELNIVRGILTLLLLLSFITLTVWLYARKHRHVFDAAARMPLEDDSSSSVDAEHSAITTNAGQSS